jgi:hypothetical protein
MKVFKSWSGFRSKYVSDALRSWLPKVIQAVKPWMSDEDISTGMRWSTEISSELETTHVGIICVTPENQNKPWLMFEAGALSKTISQGYVCPYLIDLAPSQLTGPLAQFQASVADREGTSRMLQTLNKALDNFQIPSQELDDIFDVWWPRLEQQLQKVPAETEEKIVIRSQDEILEEIVQNTREQLQREKTRLQLSMRRDEKLDSVLVSLESALTQSSSFLGMLSAEPSGQQPVSPNPAALTEFLKQLSTPDLSSVQDGQFEMLAHLKALHAQSKKDTQELLKDEPNQLTDEIENQ